MSKIASFTYTKANNVESERVVAVLTSPSAYMTGIDISELTPEEQVNFTKELGNIHDEYIQAMADLKADFDVSKNYRQFDPLKMTGVTYDHV